jgi:DNA polymerase III sliding clamp (beta) subunit (PCNA family)
VTIGAEAFETVRHAVSRDRKAPAALRCILVERVGDVVRAVATDRHRLVVFEQQATDDDPDRVLLDPGSLEPATGVDGSDFPDYERLLAGDVTGVSATVDGPVLLRTLEDAADDGPLAVHVGDDGVRFGEDALLHVDPGYLHDALAAAGDGPVVIEASGQTAPLVIRTPSVLTLLMPLRVR